MHPTTGYYQLAGLARQALAVLGPQPRPSKQPLQKPAR